MTISPTMSLISAASRDDVRLSPAELGYFQGRAHAQAHSLVLRLFLRLADEGLTRGFLARRLGKRPEQITRWLGAPGNWTLGTLSDLLVAMGHEMQINARPIADISRGNYRHPLLEELSTTGNATASFRLEDLKIDPSQHQ